LNSTSNKILAYSDDRIKEDEMGTVVACMGAMRNAHKFLGGKPGGKRRLLRHRRTWEDNIKMDLRKTRWADVNWIYLAQERDRWQALMNKVMNLWVS
jgi:hypothetical protein